MRVRVHVRCACEQPMCTTTRACAPVRVYVYVRGWGICVHRREMRQLLSSTFSTAGAGGELGRRSGCEGGSVTTGVSAMALPSSQWDIVRAREQLQNDVDMFNACFPVQGKPVREHESRILFRVHGTCVGAGISLCTL